MRSLSGTDFAVEKMQFIVPVLQHTAVLLIAVLATISTDIIAQIVTSTDSTTGNIIVLLLVVVVVDTVLSRGFLL